MCVLRRLNTLHNFYALIPWDFCKQTLLSVLYSVAFAHKNNNIYLVFCDEEKFANGITDLCILFSSSSLYIQTLVRSIIKCILVAIPLTCVGAYRPRYIRIISRVRSLSCLFVFGDSRRSQVCLGPVLFINLFISTGWELSLKAKFKGNFFARFFSPYARFSKELCLVATKRKSMWK